MNFCIGPPWQILDRQGSHTVTQLVLLCQCNPPVPGETAGVALLSLMAALTADCEYSDCLLKNQKPMMSSKQGQCYRGCLLQLPCPPLPFLKNMFPQCQTSPSTLMSYMGAPSSLASNLVSRYRDRVRASGNVQNCFCTIEIPYPRSSLEFVLLTIFLNVMKETSHRRGEVAGPQEGLKIWEKKYKVYFPHHVVENRQKYELKLLLGQGNSMVQKQFFTFSLALTLSLNWLTSLFACELGASIYISIQQVLPQFLTKNIFGVVVPPCPSCSDGPAVCSCCHQCALMFAIGIMES